MWMYTTVKRCYMKPIGAWLGASLKLLKQESREGPHRRWNYTGLKYPWKTHFIVQPEKYKGEIQNRGSHDQASERQTQQLNKVKRQDMVSERHGSKPDGKWKLWGVGQRNKRTYYLTVCVLTNSSSLPPLPPHCFISAVLGIKHRVWFNLAHWICRCRTQG